MMKRNVSSLLMELLFPPRCMCCGEILPIGHKCSCMETLEASRFTSVLLDLKENRQESTHLKAAFALYPYEGKAKQAIQRFKFREREEHAIYFGKQMTEEFKKYDKALKIECIVPVPLSKKRARKRGYNQAYLLASEIALHSNIPCIGNALMKISDNKTQYSLSKQDRKANVVGMYEMNNRVLVKNKNILLVDDVITTGATLNECAKMLRLAGAASVTTFCVASTKHKREKEGE